jgi:hypothetical protein
MEEKDKEITASQELRSGNFIICGGGIVACDGFAIAELEKQKYLKEKTIRIFAIPLTEEWLLKFGFRLDNIHYTKDDVDLLMSTQMFSNELIGFFYSPNDRLEIKHVHQLQNLYFALTGEELQK